MTARYPDVPQHLDSHTWHFEEMAHMVAVGRAGRNPGDLSYPHCVAIDENYNHIYVTEWYPPRVSIFSESGEFLNALTHARMFNPYGIAVHRNNMYVTDQKAHEVFHFKTGRKPLNFALMKGSRAGKFNLPQQLAVAENGDVFIADYSDHRIQILDEFLHFQRSIKHDSMRSPVDVKLTKTEVYVLSEDSPCVHVFSHLGEKLRSFITCGEGMQVIEAWFFCLDAQKNLIISDRRANNIKVVSPDGILLHTIEGFPKGFENPRGLALMKQMKLVVIVPNESLQLKIFAP